MKATMKVFILSLFLGASTETIASPSATLSFKNFPPHQAVTFYCTLTGVENVPSRVTVNMDANDINVKGFCKGRPYVIKNGGHIRKFPASELNQYYFAALTYPTVKPDASVTVTLVDDAKLLPATAKLTCATGPEVARQLYGDQCYGGAPSTPTSYKSPYQSAPVLNADNNTNNNNLDNITK